MSIASETNRNNYLGNGAVSNYSFTFKVFTEDDLLVTVKSDLDVETTLTKTTHYTVTGAGLSAGGSITLVNGAFDWIASGSLKNNYTLSIRRYVDVIQETDIRNQGEFYPEVHEDAFDYLTMIDLQQQDEINRSVKLSETALVADFDPTLPVGLIGEVNKVLMTNATGDGFEVGPSAASVSNAQGYATAAAASAAAALVSENAAAASASAASTSASNAATSASNAATSESNINSAISTHNSDTTSVHGIADTSLLVTTNGAQIITNKDIDGGTASNTNRITLPKDTLTNLQALTRKEGTLVYASDTDKPYFDDGTNLKVIGSGSGGSVNFITDGDAEAANIWTAYADAAATRPVDGTGGSPNVTATITSSTPLIGSNSFLFTKDAANRQGQGIATTFSVDLGYRAKVMQIEFDYIVGSGTFAAGSSSTDSDLIVYIYDVTNSALIEPSSIKLLSNSTSIGDKFIANFQTSATGASYRLILHCATTSSSAYTIKLDSVRVGPCSYVYGTPVSDWIAFTPTGSFTNATYTGFYRRVGDSEEYDVKMIMTGTPGAATLSINNRSGVTIDTAKLSYPTTDRTILGTAQILDSGSAALVGYVAYNNTTSVLVQPWTLDTLTTGYIRQTGAVTQAVPMTWAVNDALHIKYSIPVIGRSSSIQMSDGYNSRDIIFNIKNYSGTIATSAGVWTTGTFTTAEIDTTASFNGSDSWIAPVSGYYKIIVLGSQNTPAAQYFDVGYRINSGTDVLIGRGFGIASADAVVTGTDIVYINAGQTVQARYRTQGTEGINLRQLRIEKSTAPQTVSMTEKCIYSASNSAGTTVATGATGTIIPFATVSKDTHGSFVSGVFTASRTMDIDVSAMIQFTANSTGYRGVKVMKNGSLFRYLGLNGTPSATNGCAVDGSCIVSLLAGETVSIYGEQNSGGNLNLQADGASNWISIKEIK